MGILLFAVPWLGLGCAGAHGPEPALAAADDAPGVVIGRVVVTGPSQLPKIVYLEPLQGTYMDSSGRAPSRQSLARLLDTHLAVIRAGGRTELRNDTPVVHRIFSRSEHNAFQLPPLKSGAVGSIPPLRAGEIHLYCVLHPWEDASLIATPSRWAALVDSSGAFRIEGVREGSYRLVVWDEGTVRGVASIRVSRLATVSIDLQLDDASVPGSD